MTKVALQVHDDSLAPMFMKGDVIVIDVQCNVCSDLIISSVSEKSIYLAPTPASQHSPVVGTLISHHRYF